MEKQAGGRKSLGVVLVATLLVFLAILVVFLYQTRENHREGIILPTAPETNPEIPTESVETISPFITVDRENVAKVIATMTRPVAYRQTVELTTYSSQGNSTQTVTTWQNGQLQKAEVQGKNMEKHLLTQGEKVWIWYGGDTDSVCLTLTDEITFENLLAIPTYETVAQLPVENIAKGSFLTDETGSYLQVVTRPAPQEMVYTIDATTQLLVEAKGWREGLETMAFQQKELAILSPQDEQLVKQWMTPEGVDITAEAEN